MNILQMLEAYAKDDPNAPILFDEARSKGITYSQLDDLSGRVYAYLSGLGIGREDFVLINLPRGVMPVIAMLGIWKCGAAWVLVEDTYAPERIDYIRRDCGCKAEIAAANMEEIMATSPKSGYTQADDHDAAYAVYTSGTTGNPKGVLHEFGNLKRAIDSIGVDGVDPLTSRERVALLAPMNFVASVIVILKALSICGVKIFVVSYATIKNPIALKKFFIEKRITVTFLTPSYVRMLGNKTGPFLRMLFVGSEPANNVYNKNLDIINIYAASESGFAIGVFKIDKPYEVCPIGRPAIDCRITLITEDGKEAEPGEIGELCVENPFVRGYINLPEESERAFRNGIYRTGDLARIDENGSYVLLGRSGDMIKINGNRIEPAEIEASVKQVLGIDWAAARGFEENGKSYLCAYYTADVEVDPDKMRAELGRRLPYYMIPAYYIKIDSVPLKANGKMDRKALPKPDASDFRTDYAAPENEIQKKLCEAMAKVLKLERVGINDDFYELGGDSLGSIRVITESGLPGLNAGEIFRGRTPKKTAALYEEDQSGSDGETREAKNARAMKTEHLLTAEQLYMVDYQLYTPKSTMYNLFTMMKLDKETIDMGRMAQAMQTAVGSHPALLTTFSFNSEGEIVQRYTPEVLQDIRVERISEFEFNNIKDHLVQPFKIIGGCMYRCRVFETEKNGYVFFDVHHTLFDGTSLKVFMKTVGKAYLGMQPEPDLYYLTLQNREDEVKTEFYEESRRYFEERFEGVEWSLHPVTDHDSRKNEMGELFAPIGIEQAQMREIERYYRISRNEFFIAVAALAISIYNKKDDIMLSWIYNGREDTAALSSVGLLFRDLPVGLRLNDGMTLRELYADVQAQVQKGIEHCCYPYVAVNSQAGGTSSAYVLYQQDIRDLGGFDGFDVETIDIRQNQAASQTVLDMEILDGSDGLVLMIDYTASLYDDESMERFKDIFIKTAQGLVTYNSQTDVTVGELRKKYNSKKNLIETVKGVFKRKR